MPKRSTPQDFWKHIDQAGPDECWEWKAAKDEHGYGRVRYQGKEYAAHRLAWILTNGDPGKNGVLHRCDNPPCCNPSHHFLGDQKANMADCARKGRHPRNKTGYLPHGDAHHARARPEVMARGERNGAAKLTAADVREIRHKRTNGATLRRLAKEFGTSKGTISFIVQRQTWKHI